MPFDMRESWAVEVYLPKKLQHLSELYNYLRSKLADRRAGVTQAVPIDGFSMYEVDGAFLGDRIYEERTLVIRILFPKDPHAPPESLRQQLQELGDEIAQSVALTEEEIWICHAPQTLTVFRPQSL